jgi:hypothetical protein
MDEVLAKGNAPFDKVQMWSKPMSAVIATMSADGGGGGEASTASVAVFVLNYLSVPTNYTVDFSKLPLVARHTGAVSVRDIWARVDLPKVSGGRHTVALPPYDSALLLLEAATAR